MTAPSSRLPLIDIARGCAIVAMVVYHACWFLNDRRIIHVAIGRAPAWRMFQWAIAGTFLLLVGVGLRLATADGFKPRRYFHRLGLVAFCALVVTVTSVVLDPRRVVTFGILHCIAVCSVLGVLVALLSNRMRWMPAVLGVVVVALGATLSDPFFDARTRLWIGFTTRVPATFDYFPLAPWFGVTLIGISAGSALLHPSVSQLPARVSGAGPTARVLAFAGRHSLFLYMAHVPMLFGMVEILARVGVGEG